MAAHGVEYPLALLGREAAPDAERREEERDDDAASEDHPCILAQTGRARVGPPAVWGLKNVSNASRTPAGWPFPRRYSVDCGVSNAMSNLEDPASVDPDSLFASAIREHLELKARNAGLESDMPIDPYLEGDLLENHPLFKSEEQARIEETLDGEPAAVLSSERLPWPGEETVENAVNGERADPDSDAEGAALDEALWTGRPRDFDWGD